MENKTKLNQLYDELDHYSNFEIEDNSNHFVDTMYKIVNEEDPESIDILVKYIRDDCEYDWVCQFLALSLGGYEGEPYVKKLIENMPVLLMQAPKWLDDILDNIISDDEDLKEFEKQFHKIDDNCLLKLQEIFEDEESFCHQHLEVLQRLMKARKG